MDTLFNLESFNAVLAEYAKEAEEIYKYQISLGGHNASRNLTNNVKSIINVNGTQYEVCLQLEYYWKFIEMGSQGTVSSPPGAKGKAHFPPVSAIEKWISVKPIIPQPMKLPSGKMEIPSPRKLAGAIAKSIQMYGIEPFPAVEETKRQTLDIYRERLSEALGRDVEAYIRKVFAD